MSDFIIVLSTKAEMYGVNSYNFQTIFRSMHFQSS